MKKIGICTVFKGFNYGSSLQALATKQILKDLGYESEVIDLKGSIYKGRDIRLGKLFTVILRTLFHPAVGYKYFRSFSHKNNHLSIETKNLFLEFYLNKINPVSYTYRELKRIAKDDEYIVFLCGSDQIWNASSLYVDPFYYLRFAPKEKRISFAPSFGRECIPSYNKKIIRKYISDINRVSIREVSGIKVLYELCNIKAIQIIDPTLLVSRQQWSVLAKQSSLVYKGGYILAYFLSEPSEKACDKLLYLQKQYNLKIITLPYSYNNIGGDCVSAGPIDFLNLIEHADFVVTDSFHGVAFSLNFRKEFFVFSRNYGVAENQSTRIVSILESINMIDRMDSKYNSNDLIDYSTFEIFIEKERQKANQYLLTSIEYIQNN